MTVKNAHIIHSEGAPREGRISPFVANVERNIKLTFPHLNIRQNATLSSNPSLVYPTVYLSPLVTLTARGYTKHYFEGSRRICSSVVGGFSRVDWDSISRKDDGELMTDCDGLVSRLEEGCIVDDVSQAKPLSESGDFLRFGSEVHWTSSSYGEDWVDISTFNFIRRFPRLNIRASSSVFGLSETFSYDTAQVGFYRFNIAEVERRASLLALPRCSNVIEDNGKEKDPETGFLYYGARYHWPEVWSGWLSPDPMMDVYPGISPYNYCNWNPLIFVDPDGREVGDYYDKNGKWLYNDGKNDWKIYVEDQKNGVFMGPFQQSHYREVGTVTSVELTYTGNAAVLNNLNICGANGTLSMIQHCDDGNSYVRFSLDAKSGPYSNGSLENGSYTVKQGWQRNENGYRQNGVGFCFPIIPDFETGRTELLIHPDGNNPGTKGCIGITADTFTLKDFYKTTRASIDNYGNLPLTVDIKNNVNNNGKRSTPSILNE